MDQMLKKILSLPKEIQNEIDLFKIEHRIKHETLLWHVFLELDDLLNYTYCDNECCEKELYLFDKNLVQKEIFNETQYFCCKECASYKLWSINYDLRKNPQLYNLLNLNSRNNSIQWQNFSYSK